MEQQKTSQSLNARPILSSRKKLKLKKIKK